MKEQTVSKVLTELTDAMGYEQGNKVHLAAFRKAEKEIHEMFESLVLLNKDLNERIPYATEPLFGIDKEELKKKIQKFV